METIVLKKRIAGVYPAYSSQNDNMSQEEEDHELSLFLGEELDEEGFNRELRAHTDRIKILEAELQRARAEAYQAGFEEGQQIARNEAAKQFTQSTTEFSLTIQSIHEEFKNVVEKLTDPVLALAFGAAEKIVKRDLEMDGKSEEILLAQVQRVLNETATQTKAVIQVNSEQLSYITGVDVLKQLNVPHNGSLRFIPNPQLGPGECLLETEDYLVDGTIHTQLAILEKALKDTHAADH